jgi:hypothetical protein
MSAIATPAIDRDQTGRAAINRANAQHSTGPRTEPGKQRSSLNAIRHGLTAASPVLPSEDPAAYEAYGRQFIDEYQPATATESQLVQELIDTSWRLNRIPLLEANVLERARNPGLPPDVLAQKRALDILDAYRLLNNLSIQSQRLSRQFQKALDKLREVQTERREHERSQLKDAAALLELHKHKGLPWEPADDGFVFSKDQVELAARRLMLQNEGRNAANLLFEMPAQVQIAH